MEALGVITRAGYDVTLKPRPGSVDPDLATAQLCETLTRLYPGLDRQQIIAMARQTVPQVSGFGHREGRKIDA